MAGQLKAMTSEEFSAWQKNQLACSPQQFPAPEDRDSDASVGIDPYSGKQDTQDMAKSTKQPTAIEEAHNVIYGDREKTYGDPGKNLRTIAEYWTTHLKAKYHIKSPLTVDDVCVMMVLLKQARLVNSPKHRDSIVDSIGYMALADRVNVAEGKAQSVDNKIPQFVQGL